MPNKLIPPYDGCGDYLELAIEEDGALLHWDNDLDFGDFVEDGQEPQPIKTNKWHRAKDAYYDVMRHNLNEEYGRSIKISYNSAQSGKKVEIAPTYKAWNGTSGHIYGGKNGISGYVYGCKNQNKLAKLLLKLWNKWIFLC